MSTASLTKSRLDAMRRDCRLTGGEPYGWSPDSDGNLHPVESEQRVVRWIVDKRAAGMTLRAIAEELTAAGVPTKKGRGAWNHNTVAGIQKRARWYGETVRSILERQKKLQ